MSRFPLRLLNPSPFPRRKPLDGRVSRPARWPKLLPLLLVCGPVSLAVAQLTRAPKPSYSHYDIREHSVSLRQRPAGSGAVGPGVEEGLLTATSSRPSGAVYSLQGPLTAPQPGEPEEIARAFLGASRSNARAPIAASSQDSLELVLLSRSRSPRIGLTHLVFQTVYRGIPFFDGETRAHVDEQGRIWRISGPSAALPVPVVHEPRLSAREAVLRALESLTGHAVPAPSLVEASGGPARARSAAPDRSVFVSPELSTPAAAGLTRFVLGEEAILSWHIYAGLRGGSAYEVVVDALEGRLLYSRGMTYHERPEGLVFRATDRASPLRGPQTVEPFTGWPASHGDCPAEVYPEPFRSGSQRQRCWVFGQHSAGNNADVCLDADGDNACDRRAASSQDRFAFPFRDAFDRENDSVTDRDAALANAFYWANALHDWLYRLGFDEPAGNFQAANFGRGGAEGDAVRIDLQDPAALNNATFTAAPDGIQPRMELGLFAGLRRDPAFDADILTHEYVHGLTTRLIGGPASVNGLSVWQSGALGEGWSDAYAASFTGDPVIGEYSSRNPATGIRTVAYDNSPYTFGHFGTLRPTVIPNSGGLLLGLPQVHRDGEIWATVLWDLRQALGRDGFEHAVTAALQLTPRRPSMLDARDAIVQAAQARGLGGANSCGVWAAFAGRGFGFSAALNPIQPGHANDAALSVFESFDLPASCGGTPPAAGSLLLEENGELEPAWVPSGQWHRTSRRAASGSFSWWYGQEAQGNYATGARNRGSLTSPPIDLTSAAGAIIEWDQFLRTEGFHHAMELGGTIGPFLNADSGRLMVSTDGGSSWRVVTHLAHPTPGDGFVRYRINLSRYAGQTIRLRFDFDTFDGKDNGHEGWYLDNIRVSRLGAETAALAVDPPVLRFTAEAGSQPAARSVAVTAPGGSGEQVWTARVAHGGAWLHLLPASGVTPSTVQVSAASLALGPGSYQGEIQFEILGQPEAVTTVVVHLDVESAGPLAAWSLDEEGQGPGIPIADGSGNGHHAVTVGPGTRAAPGVAGRGRLFDGLGAFAAAAPSRDFSAPRMTLRTWLKLENYPRTLGVIASALDPATLEGWVAGVLETGHVVVLARGPAASGASGEILWLVSRRKLALGEWRTVAATFDRTDGVAALYLDGEIEASAPFPGFNPQAAPLTVGKASWWDGYYLHFAIDELELDSQAWTPAQVRQDLAWFDPPPADAPVSAVAEWRFDQVEESLAGGFHDDSGGGHHAALHGNGLSITDGVVGQAVRLDGAAGYAAVPQHGDFASPSFSFSAWVRLDAYPTGWGVVFSNFDGGQQGWFTGVNHDGRVILSIWGQPSFSSWGLSEGRLSLGRWHHLAVTFDDLPRRAVLYLDGKPDRSLQPAGYTPQTALPLTFARAAWFNGYSLRYALDEARIYPAALPAREIRREFERLQPAAPLRPAADARR